MSFQIQSLACVPRDMLTSHAACVIGASIICIDLVLNPISRFRNFKIAESSTFLASSMSLSFGVMIFSALYSMLPSSKRYLLASGMPPANAGWAMLGCFIAGFVGIQILSRVLHSYMPSHVVDCDHSHAETPEGLSRHASSGAVPGIYQHSNGHPHSHSQPPTRRCSHGHQHSHGGISRKHTHDSTASNKAAPSESTPLLPGRDGRLRGRSLLPRGTDETPASADRRPSLAQLHSRVLSFVTDSKSNCDEAGPCFGYSEPCGRECFKHFLTTRANSLIRPPTFLRKVVTMNEQQRTVDEEEQNGATGSSTEVGTSPCCKSRSQSHDSHSPHGHVHDASHHSGRERSGSCSSDESCTMQEDLEAQEAHHHHVPENAFLTLSLQTSIAIALHKLPEGFITYATNHASPALGFSVFMALFIHNITEGFAMALPLYLALGSRFKAILWSSLLGGISQPLGAGIAALWFWSARPSSPSLLSHPEPGSGSGGDGHEGPGEAVYGAMFAVTAGIMVRVALQLFVEATGMCHRKEVCVGAAVVGMCLLAGSSALTA